MISMNLPSQSDLFWYLLPPGHRLKTIFRLNHSWPALCKALGADVIKHVGLWRFHYSDKHFMWAVVIVSKDLWNEKHDGHLLCNILLWKSLTFLCEIITFCARILARRLACKVKPRLPAKADLFREHISPFVRNACKRKPISTDKARFMQERNFLCKNLAFYARSELFLQESWQGALLVR